MRIFFKALNQKSMLLILFFPGADGRSLYMIRSKNGICKEVSDSDIIGPGFHSISSFVLKPDQKVFLTYQGKLASCMVFPQEKNWNMIMFHWCAPVYIQSCTDIVEHGRICHYLNWYFWTLNSSGREISGSVVRHQPHIDEVLVRIDAASLKNSPNGEFNSSCLWNIKGHFKLAKRNNDKAF